MNEDEESPEESDTKVAKLKDTFKFLDLFDGYINEEIWKNRFEVKMDVYLAQFADPNLKIFME